MRLTPLVFLLLAAMSVTGCGTNPPVVPPSPVLEYGRVLVLSNADSANIFLDGLNTGLVTPDTITATVGVHTVKVERPGYLSASRSVQVQRDSLTSVYVQLQGVAIQKVVLLEDFSNVSCIPCVPANAILRALANGTFGRQRVAVIKYATNFPSATDPFYTANRSDCNARMAYYGILFAPTLIVDGTSRPVATNSQEISDSINARLQRPGEIDLRVARSINGGMLTISVSILAMDTTGLELPNLLLHTVVTETDIVYATPPGANGETQFHDVMRAMLPSNAGTPLSSSVPQQYDRQVALAPSWNAANLYVVAFVQNHRTKEVLQAASTY